jgi:hypothetical protein
VSSKESSNRKVVSPFSQLNILSKYSLHLCLISISFTKWCSIPSLMHLTWSKSLVFLSRSLVILYMSFSFLRTQVLVKVFIRSTFCHTYNSLCSLLCYLVLLYVVHTSIMVQMSITFFLKNNPLDFFIAPPSIFTFASAPFSCSMNL